MKLQAVQVQRLEHRLHLALRRIHKQPNHAHEGWQCCPDLQGLLQRYMTRAGGIENQSDGISTELRCSARMFHGGDSADLYPGSFGGGSRHDNSVSAKRVRF